MSHEQPDHSPKFDRRTFLKGAGVAIGGVLFGPSLVAQAAKDQSPATQPPLVIPVVTEAPFQTRPEVANSNKRLRALWDEPVSSNAELYKRIIDITGEQFADLFQIPQSISSLFPNSVLFVPPEKIKSTRPTLKSELAITDASKRRVYINQKRFEDTIEQIRINQLPRLTTAFANALQRDPKDNKQAITVEFLWHLLAHEWGHMVTNKTQTLDFGTPVPTYSYTGDATRPDYYIMGLNQFNIRLRPGDAPNSKMWEFEQKGLNEAIAEWYALTLAENTGRPYIDQDDCSFGANMVHTLVKKAGIKPSEVAKYTLGEKPLAEFFVRMDRAIGGKTGDAARLLQVYVEYENQSKDMTPEGMKTLQADYRRLILQNTGLSV